MKPNLKVRTLVTACSLAAGAASSVYAESDVAAAPQRGRTTVEEIIVTAQKREQNMQDVPISVVTLGGDNLEKQNRNEISDVSKMVAGFTFKSGSSDADKSIQVRGVGTATFSRGVEQSVGTVIDGVVSNTTAASFLDFGDVERIEVLRGPQGMLFGKNASAGLLNITTKRPSEELTFGARLSYGEENEIKTGAYISGPLAGDQLLGRLSYYSNQRDGIIENVGPSGGQFNDRHEWGVKGKLLFKPTDSLSVALDYTHAKRDQDCCVRPAAEFDTTNFWYNNYILATGAPAGKENDKIYAVKAKNPGGTDLDVYSMEANYDVNDYTLTSITSYTDSSDFNNAVEFGIVGDLVPINQAKADSTQWTQEFRITSPVDQTISYVAGLYYFDNKLKRDFYRIQDLTLFFAPFLFSTSNYSEIHSDGYAAFGQATWNISEASRLSLGARYNKEKISLYSDVSVVDPVSRGFTVPAGATVAAESQPGVIDASKNGEAVSWRIIYEHDITDSAMVYGSLARGYKGPGANSEFGANTAPSPFVDAEIPTSYEVGLKSQWLDNSLRLNVSLFRTDFKDFQASVSDNKIPPQFYLANAGKLRTQGMEVEMELQATENFLLSANVAAIDAKFEKFEGAACYFGQTAAQGCSGGTQDLSGKDLPYSPDLTVNLFARYDIPLSSLPFNAYVQGSYHWQDETQFEASNNPKSIGDSYGIADMAIGIESHSGTYHAQLFVKNLFDKFYYSSVNTEASGLGVAKAYGLEYDYTRRFGVSVGMDF